MKNKNPISINSKAGSCIFFHCNLIHGSSHNISPLDRRIILYQVSTVKEYDEKYIKKINKKNILNRKKYEKIELEKRLRKIK